MLRLLVNIIARPLLLIFERSWKSREVSMDWKKANVTQVFKHGKNKDPGIYKAVNLTSVPGTMMEHLILEAVSNHV